VVGAEYRHRADAVAQVFLQLAGDVGLGDLGRAGLDAVGDAQVGVAGDQGRHHGLAAQVDDFRAARGLGALLLHGLDAAIADHDAAVLDRRAAPAVDDAGALQDGGLGRWLRHGAGARQ